MKQILIVEDNLICQGNIKRALSPAFHCLLAANRKDCLAVLQSNAVDLILLDLSLPDCTDTSLLDEIVHKNNDIPVIIITQDSDPETAAEVIKHGAKDYVLKTKFYKDKEVLLNKIRILLDANSYKLINAAQAAQIKYLNRKMFIPELPEYKHAYQQAEIAMKGNLSLMISGESGSGKGVLISLVHEKICPEKPFAAIDCGAIPSTLIESELFGFEKGAFTGAITSKPGKVELANNGILFLDEIHNASLEVQSKYLRLLQERRICRIGSTKEIDVDFMLITATNKNLREEVEKGRFKDDLYYRIKQIEIIMPSLRDSKKALMQFMEYFISFYNNKYATNFEVTEELRINFIKRTWPGNIRELDSELQKIVFAHSLNQDWRLYLNQGPHDFIEKEITLKEQLLNQEKNQIDKALKDNNYNISGAAKDLRIPRTTLHNKLKKHENILKDCR